MAASLIENVRANLESTTLIEEPVTPLEKTEKLDNGNDPVQLPRLSYSKELLLKLKQHPASILKPKCLDSAHMVAKSGKWDPEHWMSSDTSKHSNGGAGEDHHATVNKKRERAKEERDDYCFTPQRRSFVTGCQVSSTRRPETENAATQSEKAQEMQSNRLAAIRTTRERTRPFEREHRGPLSKSETGDKEFRKPMERFGFERDGNRNMRNRPRVEETPEWFSGGPTSQNETIELKGFDEESGKLKRKVEVKKLTNGSLPEPASSTAESNTQKKDFTIESKKEPEFNLDDLLNMEPAGFNGLDSDTGHSDTALLQGSKFSRWFKKSDDPERKEDSSVKDKEDAAKSLLEMLQKGSDQEQLAPVQQTKLQGVLTAEEVEQMASKKDALAALRTLLPTAKEVPKRSSSSSTAGRPMTEQDLLASLLGDKANVSKPPPQQQQNQPNEDVLAKFLQLAQQQHQPGPSLPLPPQDVQQRMNMQAMMLNAAAAGLNGAQSLQQLEFLARQRQLLQTQVKHSSASPLAFTPTAVMRKMTADKDKEKVNKGHSNEKVTGDIAEGKFTGTNARLTGRTASQVQGYDEGSAQLGVANLTGPPLQRLPPQLAGFGNQMNPANATADITLKLLEQQQQLLLNRAVAVSAAQNQLKQAMKQQQQRMSPLQQPLLPMHGAPILARNHFRPIQPQPPLPAGPGFAPFMVGPLAAAGQQQRGGPRLRDPVPNFALQQQLAALHAQRMNSLPGNRPLSQSQQQPLNNQGPSWLAPNLNLQGPLVPKPKIPTME